MARRLTLTILIAMIAGAVVGLVLHATLVGPTLASVAGWLTIPSDLFLRLIKMIIAPLVFATLVTGIAHMGDTSRARPDRRQDARLVRRRVAGVADARAAPRQPARSPARIAG